MRHLYRMILSVTKENVVHDGGHKVYALATGAGSPRYTLVPRAGSPRYTSVIGLAALGTHL